MADYSSDPILQAIRAYGGQGGATGLPTPRNEPFAGDPTLQAIRTYKQQHQTDQQLMSPEVAAAAGVDQEPTEAAPTKAQSPHAQRGWFQTLASATQRGFGELAETPTVLSAVGAEAMGDTEYAKELMEKAKAARAALPEAQWNFANVHDLGDFGYWLTERFGEATPGIIAMLGSGGVGGVATALASRGLANMATRAALVHAGSLGATFGTTAAMDIAGVASEQYGATGSTQPGVSVPTGLAGGALQTYLPLKVLGALKGDPFAPTWAGAMAKGAAIGGGAGTATDLLHIAARKMTDPSFDFFADGPQRIAESALTNIILGAGLGAVAHLFERKARPPTSPFRPEEGGPPAAERIEEIVPGQRRTAEDITGQQELPLEGGEATRPPLGPWPPEPPSGGPPMPKHARGELQPGEVDQLAKQQEEDVTGLAQRTTLESKIGPTRGGLSKEEEFELRQVKADIESLSEISDKRDLKPEEEQMVFDRVARMRELEAKQKAGPTQPPAEMGAREEPQVQKLRDLAARTTREETIKQIEEMRPKTYQDALLYSVSTNWKAPNPKFLDWLDPKRFLESEYLWGMSKRMSDETGKPQNVAYAELANYIFGKIKPKGDWKLTPESATAEMARQTTEAEFQRIGIPGKMRLGGPKIVPHSDVPHAPEGSTGATSPLPGPITQMRRQIIKQPVDPDRSIKESLIDQGNDAFGAMPLLREGISAMMDQERMLDWMEANTARYAIEDPASRNGYLARLMTDTDLEKLSVDYPQSKRLNFWEIDQGSLQPAMLSADVFDLPRMGSERIWFLEGTTPEERVTLLREYDKLQQAAETVRPSTLHSRGVEIQARKGADTATGPVRGLEDHYADLLHGGLRVIPSRGSSFYYNGTFEARPGNPLTTGRSKQIVFYDPATGLMKSGDPNAETPGVPAAYAYGLTEPPEGLPVALDLNKFKPGEVFGLRMDSKAEDLMFHEDVPVGRQMQLREMFRDLMEDPARTDEGTVASLRDLMQKGAWIPPTKADDSIVTKEPLSLDRLTPGVVQYRDFSSKSVDAEPQFLRNSEIYTAPNRRQSDAATRLRQFVANMLPAIDGILEKLGIDGRLQFILGDSSQYGSRGVAHLDMGTILLDPPLFIGQGKNKNENMTIVMHEVGHFISYHIMAQVPSEMHTMIRYAYNKALLEDRIAPLSSAARMGIAPTGVWPIGRATVYSRTYPEWLAEQTRRWMGSSQVPRTMLEYQFKKGADVLERFYSLWEKEVDVRSAMDLREPTVHFSALMDYWRKYGSKGEMWPTQSISSWTLHRIGSDAPGSPAMDQLLASGPLRALQELQHMMPPGVQHEINRFLKPEYGEATEGAHGRTLPPLPGVRRLPLIELALGSLPHPDDVHFSRIFWTHELTHVYRMMGLMSEQEFRLLERHADEGGIKLGANEIASLRDRITKQGEAEGWSKPYQDWLHKEMVSEEKVAQHLEKFANDEPTDPAGHGIMQMLRNLMERIRNYLVGDGFQTRADVLRSIFNGEMAHRPDRTAERIAMLQEMSKRPDFGPIAPPSAPMTAGAVAGRPDMLVYKFYWPQPYSRREKWIYRFYSAEDVSRVPAGLDPMKQQVVPKGWVIVGRDPGPAGGHDVDMIRSNNKTDFLLMKIMMNHWERDLGVTAKPSGILTWQGRRMAQLRWREETKHYVWSNEDRYWYSPNFIKARLEEATATIEAPNGETFPLNHPLYEKWKKLYDKVPKETWDNPILKNMYMLPRNWERDEVQGAVGRAGHASDQQQVQASLGALGADSNAQDEFSALADRKQLESQSRAAREMGLPMSQVAPRQPAMEMANIFDRLREHVKRNIERGEGYRESEDISKKLTGIQNESDRIGWFTKKWWDINQLLWNNEHIEGLRQYVAGVKLWYKHVANWQTRADETIKAWRQLSDTDRAGINNVLFNLAEMKYLPSGAPRRNPTASEYARLLAAEKLSPEAIKVVERVRLDYKDYIDAAERMSIERIISTSSDPVSQALRIAKVKQEYNQLREKPFFPMTRFGRYTIAVRDLGDPKQPVIWSSAYDTRAQRDAALDQVRAAHPGQKITYGVVPEHSAEFMGLPGPLLRLIKQELPGISKDQLDWIEEFEQIHAPDNTFRRKWLPQNGLPGYSMDAMRAHSAFFLNGSNYLARLSFQKTLQDAIMSVEKSVRETPFTNTAKRQEILKYMQDHYRYITEGGRDWGKTKAFISLWQLGFSPAAAFVNLLQTPTTTLPHLMGEFGNAIGLKNFARALDRNFKPMGQFDKAREQMGMEGLIDVGQAADLASYAEGHNMLQALAGDKAQQVWQEAAFRGMWMFQKAEQLNRVITAKAAWQSAMENPNHQRLTEVKLYYPKELSELMDPTNYKDGKGLTEQEAAAYLYAKETLEKTQFTFAKWNRPPFLRSQLSQVLLIFFKYTQNMMELYRITPGLMQMALIQGALFGLAGMPGAEDMNQVMRSVGHLGVWLLRKVGINLYGKDFDLLDKAREYTRQVTEGTVFDKVGPDLFLHGLSRYGFGLGLLPESMGIGAFDASQNGSLGRIVPGLQEGLRGLAFGDIKSGVNDVAQRAAGAGYGWFFNLAKYMNEDPGTFDSKTWESLLPRSLRGLQRANRFYQEGQTTRQGGRLMKFDATDPEDFGALLTQAMGLNPRKVSQMNDYMQQVRDQLQLLQAEKTMIYGQLDKALASGKQGAINDVLKAVDDYNRQVAPEYPTLAIQKQGLVTSIMNRIKTRQMQTEFQQGGPVNRATIPVARKIRENFPEVVDQRSVR